MKPHLTEDAMINHPALVRFAERRLNMMCLNYEQARFKPEEAAIHDLRVSVRRVIGLLGFLEFLCDGEPEKARICSAERRRLKKQLKALNRLRDLQVQLRYLKGPELKVPYPEALLQELTAQEHGELAALKTAMEAWPLTKTRRRALKLIRETVIPPRELELKTQLYLRYLTDRLHESVHCCQKPDPDSCHRLRVRLKQYRYCLEILDQGFGLRQILMGAVRQWQNDLGTLQDRKVLLSFVEASAAFEAAGPLREALGAEIGQLLAQVREEACAIRYETQLN